MNYSKIKNERPGLWQAVQSQHGFLNMDQVRAFAEVDRMAQLLIRCGNGRFSTAAQNVEWFVGIIQREGTDYVRDISLLA
jgi:beta-lactamase class D